MAEVIVALDLGTTRDALALVDRLPGLRWAKVGPVLFTAEGPRLVRELRARGVRVFLDLKWHDIPEIVGPAVEAAGRLDVGLATVHALGGREMLAAAAARAGAELTLVAVTVLTSHDAASLTALLGREVSDVGAEVLRLARIAVGAGCLGVAASPHEVAMLREQLGPGPVIVVPGIRRLGDDPGSQRRVASPGEAARAGATHLVVGRAITRAADPAGVYADLLEQAAS